MYSRDIERLARTFFKQKLDAEYIRHYLVETYQLDLKTVDEIIAKVAPASHGKSSGKSGQNGDINPPPVKRQKFY